ncbi:hypothetical protein DH2020_028372 [Rehmannia glutinosa]|uniref:Leucine-rich repeat-containing N-terminal plant-type domain-containing protein n=1 Tax=Rehmannia glutinosa TaxID=99300 RepID=A0ABR0VRK9_REHGL
MAISGTIFILFTLVFIHGLTICSSQTNSSRVKCIDRERIALSKFRKSLTDESSRLSSWIGQECCSWKGITCSNKTGHVLKLNLHNPTPFDNDKFYNSQDGEYIAYYSKSCLAGELNPALLDLKQLQFLDLSMNNFSGSEIPKFFGSFQNLKHLNLSVARFQGNVPPHIGNLSRLEVLDLSDFWTNRLTSESLHWVSSLSYLKHLDLSGVSLGRAKNWLDSVNGLPFLTKLNLSNTLVATIPPLTRRPNFTSLVSLDLQWNIITSDIPHWLFDLSNLIELHLDGNGIRGPIPEAFGKLTNLTVLGLSRNYFNTSVPDSLFNLRNLTYLDLSQNKLQGTISNAIVNLCNLKFLDLTDNRFTGKIPDFGINQNDCLQDLDVLRISYNSLHGPISASFGTLSSLRELDISNNIVNGSIPSSFGQLSNLEKLELSNNSLSGMVTELHFSKMSKLTELSMSLNNLLVFNVSSEWIPPFQLKTIKLSSCTLGPLFPSWLKTQENVVELRISRTGISDRLPDWFEKVYSRVHYLDISKNNISGELPQFEEANNRPFRRLILNSNSFDGSLRPLPSDVLLWDVSNNFVSGNIPIQNGTNLTLEVLILKITRLHRRNRKPVDARFDKQHSTWRNSEFLGKFTTVVLTLAQQQFPGTTPVSGERDVSQYSRCGEKLIHGVIPPWIGENQQYLAFLSLQSNNFHGEITEKLCQVPQLQLLNLARNNLTGNIPPCIGNFSAMITDHSSIEYLMLDVDYGGSIPGIINGIERRYTKTMPFLTSIDISDNSIVGEIPDNLTGLVGLRNLNLAGNNLTGRIPGKIGDMQELISLDLSRNELSGQIPPSLSDLNFLTYLNLSYNNLSGRIPNGNQLRTLDPSVYLGNDGLCGAPLVRRCDGDAPAPQDNDRTDINEGDDDDDSLFPWFYAGIGPGFLFGFLVVCGILHFVRSWSLG